MSESRATDQREMHSTEHDAATAARASSLDIAAEELRTLADRAVALVADYFAHIAEQPVFPQTSAKEVAAKLAAPLPLAGPDALDELFNDCARIFANSRQNGHPRFFGYVASPATPIGAFADLIASALNQNVPVWRSAPAATHIERTTVRWLAELIGYPQGAGGLLTPLGEAFSILDIVQEFDANLIIVAPNKLGAINQSLLALHAAEGRARLVLMRQKTEDASAESNGAILRELSAPVPVYDFPFLPGTKNYPTVNAVR